MTVINKEKLFLMKKNIQSCLEEVCRRERIDITDLELISESYEGKRDITYHTYLHKNKGEYKLIYHRTIDSQNDSCDVVMPEGSYSSLYVYFTNSDECIGRE